ncbi:MAG: acyl-CoA dehydrogenase [Myxococcota bacterium]|jgi:acyl-CoA dehydrogenase
MSDFRAEVVAFIEAHAPRELWGTATSPFQGHWGGSDSGYSSPAHVVWFEAALERGWTAPTWPRAYGGGGLSREEGAILIAELNRLGIPRPLVGFGLSMIGPIILSYGTEAQKKLHLTAIARGEVRWCQGYSEPGAGSDLAALACRAERDGDHFVVNGQKIWTSFADKADWIFCLVRTAPVKHSGITFLLIDMATPGIEVRPIELISGNSPFCETFITDVRVPAENVVGEINAGWAIARALLGHERDSIGEAIINGGSRPPVLANFSLRDHAIDLIGRDATGKLADPILRAAVADHEIVRQVGRLTLGRIRDTLGRGGRPGPETSIVKVFGTELNQDRWALAQRILGLEGLYWTNDDPTNHALARTWLRARGNTIEGGTSEVQLNIIATAVLGLPRLSSSGKVTPAGNAPSAASLLTDEQAMISDAARDFLANHAPISRARAMRDAATPFDPALWAQMVELGWSALLIDEEADGFGLGMAELALVCEHLGTHLTPSPLLSTVIAAHVFADEPESLTAIAGGAVFALADHEPRARGGVRRTAAEVVEGGVRVVGVKSAVLDAAAASSFLVTAVGADGAAVLALVAADAEGVTVTAERRLDGRDSGRVEFSGAVGRVLDAARLPAAIDRATIALCAEMLGSMQSIFASTLDYLKTRQQFNRPIGSFQALQHRAARLYIDIELCRAAVGAAAVAADGDGENLAAMASMAKVQCSEVFEHTALEAIQLHGGIGMTDEHDAGLFLKRARVAAATFGTADVHRDRWAVIRGY